MDIYKTSAHPSKPSYTKIYGYNYSTHNIDVYMTDCVAYYPLLHVTLTVVVPRNNDHQHPSKVALIARIKFYISYINVEFVLY